MGRCIVYNGIRLLLLIRPFIYSFFVLFNFQTLKIFVTLFSGIVRLRRLKLGTRVDSVQMYRVYRNQAAGAYSSLYFSFFFPSHFQALKFSSDSSRELWGRESFNFVQTWTVGGCIAYTKIKLLLLILLFSSLFFFLSNFQTFKILSHFSQKLWVLKSWN